MSLNKVHTLKPNYNMPTVQLLDLHNALTEETKVFVPYKDKYDIFFNIGEGYDLKYVRVDNNIYTDREISDEDKLEDYNYYGLEAFMNLDSLVYNNTYQCYQFTFEEDSLVTMAHSIYFEFELKPAKFDVSAILIDANGNYAINSATRESGKYDKVINEIKEVTNKVLPECQYKGI